LNNQSLANGQEPVKAAKKTNQTKWLTMGDVFLTQMSKNGFWDWFPFYIKNMAQPSQEDIANLRECVREYTEVDNQLRELNTQVYAARDTRSAAEDRIIELMKLPQFASINQLAVSTDGSTIKIERPGTRSVPWSLSQAKLLQLLKTFFANDNTAAACFRHICDGVRQHPHRDTFAIRRIVRGVEE
jgi:hypothetical protein